MSTLQPYPQSSISSADDKLSPFLLKSLGILGMLPPGDISSTDPNLGLNDIKTGLRFFKGLASSFGGDPDKITVGGHSSGGHMIRGEYEETTRSTIPLVCAVADPRVIGSSQACWRARIWRERSARLSFNLILWYVPLPFLKPALGALTCFICFFIGIRFRDPRHDHRDPATILPTDRRVLPWDLELYWARPGLLEERQCRRIGRCTRTLDRVSEWRGSYSRCSVSGG